MAEMTPITIGTDASCTDGTCGEVSRVVVDPVARAVTHLVVEPKHWQGSGRLVPLGLVDTSTGGVKLACTMAEFEQLDAAEELQFVPGTQGYETYGPERVMTWPYYGLSGTGVQGDVLSQYQQTEFFDTVPLGEVEVRRGEHVQATDGTIGKVQGLVIDPRNHHVTHVLLQEGHLWGSKEVAIPIGAVTGVDDGIVLSLSKQEVQALPPVGIEHPAW
jgi:sporulation protein YlmC with PRC-barrel domain